MFAQFENREKVANILLTLCFAVWGVTWLYSIAFVDWGLIAGFFMGLVFGGNLAFIPLVFACYSLVRSKPKSSNLVYVLVISAIWVIAVRLLYWL